jgi:hypothetical protein
MSSVTGSETALVAANQCTVEIAGIRLRFGVSDPELKFTVQGAGQLFLVADNGLADSRLDFSLGELTEETEGELLFDSGATWQLFRANDGYTFRLAIPYFGLAPYRLARFNEDFSQGQVVVHRPYAEAWQPLNPMEYPLDELLLVQLLSQGRGAELHATGIVDEAGNGYLFLGHSGAGKTTTSNLWLQHPGVKILSDDRIVLRCDEAGRVWMYGTPWHGLGELSMAARAPLKHIFFIEKGPQAEFFDITGADAAARLFACSFPPFYDPAGLDFTLGFYERVLEAVPVAILSFRPDQTAVEAVRRRVAAL